MGKYIISIIVPIYNTENYLEECLNSLINQTFKDIEIICINDGSTDNSLEILKAYAKKDTRIKIFSQVNQGQGIARNKGIQIAKGEYILFVDPDDYINHKTCEILYNTFKKTKANIIQFDYENLYENQSLKKSRTLSKEAQEIGINCVITPNQFYNTPKAYLCLYGLRLMAWDKAYSLDFIKENHIHFAPNKYAEDHIFTIMSTINTDKIYYLNKQLYIYRCRPNSAVNKISDDNFCIFDNFRYITKFLENKNLLEKLSKEFIIYKSQIIQCHFQNISEKKKTEYIEKAKEFLPENDFRKFTQRIKYGNRSLWEFIFSLKNKIINGRKCKTLTILGFEFKIEKNKTGEI